MAVPSRQKRARPLHSLATLTPDPHNANRGTERGRAALLRSLQEYGAGRAVLLDCRGRIIAGNKTVEAARRLDMPLRVVETDGQHLIAVQRADLDLASDPRAQALAIADNRVGELDLEWDIGMLQQLRADGIDMSAFWTADEFADLCASTRTGRTDDNAVVEPGPTDIVRGDLFVLGRHRLLCGDATAAADVARLLAGAAPVVMATDPPYGVHYDPAWRHRMNPAQRTSVGRVLNDDRATWTAAWQLFPGPVAYVWHAALHASTVAQDLHEARFAIRSQIIWQKHHFALSRGDYHWGHEPAWYAVRGTGQWRGDRRQTTVWEVPNLNPLGGTRTGENGVTGHATQKPVRLFEIPLSNHTGVDDALYDPFCGSGTALIAAEKLGRPCFAMDLDPQYVQVAVTRWEAFTGATAGEGGGGAWATEVTMTAPVRRRGRGGRGGHEPRARLRARELRVLELSVLGWSQQRIATEVGITQAAVSKTLKRTELRLFQDMAALLERHKARQTLRLEYLFTEAIRAWTASQADATRRRQRQTVGGATVAELVVENQHGDPRYLDEARKALADTRKLWGLDAAQKVEVRTATNPYDGMTEDDLRTAVARQAQLLDRASPFTATVTIDQTAGAMPPHDHADHE